MKSRPCFSRFLTRFDPSHFISVIVVTKIPKVNDDVVGDFLGWHPHLHVLCTDGCFYGDGMFRVAPLFELKHLGAIFRHKVFNMLLSKGNITEDLVNMLMTWRHSGFKVFCGARIQPGDEKAMENLARYIIRASFSQERMTYIPQESRVIYQSKDGKEEKVFDL